MFRSDRQDVLDSAFENYYLEPGDELIRFVETWGYPEDNSIAPDNYRSGFLHRDQVNQWLFQAGDFTPPRSHQSHQPESTTRLLICERAKCFPRLGFPISRDTYLAIEATFNLPKDVLPIFKRHSGQYHHSVVLDEDSNIESMTVTVKLPQMYQIGNCGLAISHSFKTRTTFALWYGWNVLSSWEHITKKTIEPYHTSIEHFIQSTMSLWGHPLLLPTILLQEHLYRGDDFRGELSWQVQQIEMKLGVTQASRLVGMVKSPADLGKLMGDENFRFKLTTDLNTTKTNILNFLSVVHWDRRYCEYLTRLAGEIRGPLASSSTSSKQLELDGVLRYSECDLVSNAHFVECMSERLSLQLNVLYNFVTQYDSNLNASIAATTGLDGAAMKTLAFVTVIFLPPTFVASLFSMSMFNWQASSPDENGETVVASNFWIYWVTSIPMTLVVLIAWRVWWRYQKRYYAHMYRPKTNDAPTFSRMNTDSRGPRRWFRTAVKEKD